MGNNNNILPSSFSTLCTKQCKQELIGFLLSLSLYHPNATTYVICDTETKQYIDNSTPKPKLDIRWYIELDIYSKYNRNDMEQLGIFGNFLKYKMKSMLYALNDYDDTMLIDCDTIIMDELFIDNGYNLGLSPQFIRDKYVSTSGFYNAGLLWTNNKEIVKCWMDIINYKHSCPEQIDMIKLRKFKYFEFGDNYNLQTWRFYLGIEDGNKISSYLNVKNDKVYYKDNPLKFIHTHFNNDRFIQVNNLFIEKLTQAKRYKELAIIYRVINDKWILKIPKQPLTGLWRHNNDSYRELAVLFKINNEDVDIVYDDNTGHCWVTPSILTYDRPTLEWVNNELVKATCLLLGNGDINDEGLKLKQMGISNVFPWIFWSRKPMILEKFINSDKITGYNDRNIKTIFIGNYENNVQAKYRNNGVNWCDFIEEFYNTSGSKHKFTQEEYLNKLVSSKFGLCLRGYGSKCHREIELMALGTVPIVTPEVCISSYINPPIENIHYLKIDNIDELENKINNISPEKWQEMSSSCIEWYTKNIYSKNAWTTMIENILYT